MKSPFGPQSPFRSRAVMAAAEDASIPAHFIRRIISGESPLRVYREYRGMTREQLAAASGVQPDQIERIEAGRVDVAISTVVLLASALSVSLDRLI